MKKTLSCRLAALLFLAALLVGRPATAIVYQDAAAQAAGLGTGQSFLDGEAMLITHFTNGAYGGCSGTLLLGGSFLLTAAHCVSGADGTWRTSFVDVTFANSSQWARVTDYTVSPLWSGDLANGGDLALLRLPAPITGIAGYSLYTAAPALGAAVTITGYGDTGLGDTGYQGSTFGTLRYGRNIYDLYDPTAPAIYFYDFDRYGFPGLNHNGAVGPDEVMIAPGDSGGGTLLTVGGITYLVGVHSFIFCLSTGCTPNSTFGQFGGDVSVFANRDWLLAAMPEPAGALLLLPAMAAMALRRRPPRDFPSAAVAAIGRA